MEGEERTMRRARHVTPIVLPDDVLLAIFDFYVVTISQQKRDIEAWQLLVHLCRRWRSLVFESPRRLNLRLVCTPGTPARDTLDVWPALPLIVRGAISSISADDIVYALRHGDRICQIDLHMTEDLEWDKVLSMMQVSFPALTHLLLRCNGRIAPIPDTFLGGSAPLLQSLTLYNIQCPGTLNLLRSCTHLVDLELHNIPQFPYVSPGTMATYLSVLTNLATFSLSLGPFYSTRQDPPPPTRPILPNLTKLWYRGTSEYLEDIIARIDAPRLDVLCVIFLHELIFDAPRLVQFTSGMLRFEEPNGAEVILRLEDQAAQVRLLWATDYDLKRCVDVSCEDSGPLGPLGWTIAQICTKLLPPLPTVELLRLRVVTEDPYSKSDPKVLIKGDEWLDLLRPFTAVKSLYLSEELQPGLASALQELVEGRTMEVLPSVQNIFLAEIEPSGPFQEAIDQFLAARQRSGHPITVLQGFDNLPYSFYQSFSSVRSGTPVRRYHNLVLP